MRCPSKRVLITGASSGIGESCARRFAKEGASLLICARRIERLEALAQELTQMYQVQVYPLQLDVQNADNTVSLWHQLPTEWQDIDILVNNAGLAHSLQPVQEGNWQEWNEMIDTNIKGVLLITQLVLKNMLRRQSGHIINMGSIAGLQMYPGAAVYGATKSALRSISEGIKMDVHGTPIRVSLINAGMVAGTEFSFVRFKGDMNKVNSVYQNTAPLTPDDIADVVMYCATVPDHVDIRELTIMPTAQTAPQMVYRDSK